MSIKLMSAIFETEFTSDFEYEKNGEKKAAKASTVKLVLLAIADHANDDGQAYPGLTRLELKTALSRQGVLDTIEALKFNGMLEIKGINNARGTNIYQLNLRSFITSKELPDNIYERVVKPLDQGSQATLPVVVKPLDLNHQLTINKPLTELEQFQQFQKDKKLSKKQIDLSTKQVHDMVEHSKKAEKNKHQELPEQLIPLAKLFMDKTGIAYLPSQRTFWISSLQEWQTIGVTAEDVELAVDRMGGYVINSPKSLTTILNGLVAERKRDVDNDPRSKYTLVTED